MVEVISRLSIPDLATTYTGYVRGDKRMLIEFVDSTPEPFYNLNEKWVIIVSSQIGCRLGCKFCDATNYFFGNLKKDEIVEQVDYVINRRGVDPLQVKKFKIQFARMGEPSLNMDVIDAMLELRDRFPDYIPCIATTAPKGSERFFERLLFIKDRFRDFQLQFSINSTDRDLRDRRMPFKKLSLDWISEYSKKFFTPGKKKVVLNFALCSSDRIDYEVLSDIFDPSRNIIKLTPINPTERARESGFELEREYNKVNASLREHSERLKEYGFESIISIGDMRENIVLSNCGQIASASREWANNLKNIRNRR